MASTTPALPAAKPSSVVVRDAMRAWLRAHPACTKANMRDHLGLDSVGNMTMEQLASMIEQLGGDAQDVCAAALRGIQTSPVVPLVSLAPTAAAATPEPAPVSPVLPTDLSAQLEGLKSDLIEGGFGAIRDRLAGLIDAAAKPPVTIEVERIVHVDRLVEAAAPLAKGVHDLRPSRTTTWRDLFGPGLSDIHMITVWDHPRAPKINPIYEFPADATALALSQLARGEMSRAAGGPGKHPLLTGPAGTGKSTWAEQFAARTGRPFVLIPLNDGLELDEMIGQTVLDGQGGMVWQDGVLLAAIRQPGCVVCLDEVGGMRAAVGIAMNSLLQSMAYTVPATGERVACARGVVFIATNNGNLLDDGRATGYEGVRRQARSFADRFGVTIDIDYAPKAVERRLLVAYTGCTKALARILVDVAALSRAKARADVGDLTGGIGFRRLLAWAETLTDGSDPVLAFKSCIVNAAPASDAEVLYQLATVAVDPAAIATAITGMAPPAPVVPSPAGLDFADTSAA